MRGTGGLFYRGSGRTEWRWGLRDGGARPKPNPKPHPNPNPKPHPKPKPNPHPPSCPETALGPLLSKTVERFQLLAAEHQLELDCAAGETDLVLADQDKLQQVLDNLLSNAIKYSPQGGRVVVSCERLEGVCRLGVRDYGIGMHKEQVERVFDKFYRADSGNTSIGGLGLGMNIAQQIVQGHQGQIWVESVLTEGTLVTLTLPLS